MAEIEYRREPLKNAFISCVQPVTEKTQAFSNCYECAIENYSTVKEGIKYSMTAFDPKGDMKYTFALKKSEHFHHFYFQCEFVNPASGQKSSKDATPDKMTFYIVYEKEKTVWIGDIAKADGECVVEVRNEDALHADNKYLYEEDKIVFHFTYRHNMYSRDPICHVGNPKKTDEEVLSKDLLSLYESGMFTDFVIETADDGKTHRTHKVILGARSVYLKEEFCKRPNCESVQLDGYSESLDVALRYMYTGKLPELRCDDLLEVAEVAENLQIPALMQSLTVALREKMNKENVELIRSAAEELQMDKLLSYAEDFIAKENLN